MNLQKLISLRSGNRSVISKLLDKIEEAKTKVNLIEFNATLEALESKTTTLNTLNEKILNQTEVENIEEELLTTEEYTLDLEIRLRQLRNYQSEVQNGGTSSDNSYARPIVPSDENTLHNASFNQNAEDVNRRVYSTETAADGETGNHVNAEGHFQVAGSQDSLGNNFPSISASSQYHRLPKLTLPSFNGNILYWQTFWDSFESTVHLNYNLTDVQKFSYLKSQLEGEALRTIEGFALTNSNYIRAIELLKERYGQTHKIIHATMQALLQLPYPRNNLTCIREFYDKMETYIRALESMGQKQETYGDLLVPIVLDKLPGEIRKTLAREHGDNNWLLSSLRSAIHKEINILEAGSCNVFKPEAESYGSAATLYTGTRTHRRGNNSYRKKNELKCTLCEESHVVKDCQKYPDVTSKLNVVKEKRLCFNCFGKHQVFMCNSTKRCQKCNRKHHTTICQSKNSGGVSTTQPHSETSVMYSSVNQSRSSVLLKTAVADVYYKGIRSQAAILFDEGAQRSFITDTLANELQLPREKSERVEISAFGGKSNQTHHYDTTTVYLIADNKQKIPLKVLIVSKIAAPLDNTHVTDISRLPYLEGLKLAHPVTEDREFNISLLIGADFYWDIVEDNIIRGKGPTAVKSKIGYLLSGPMNVCSSRNSEVSRHIFNVSVSCVPEEISLERFWNIENLGITTGDLEQTYHGVMQQYQEKSIDFRNGRYITRLPWKSDHPEIPTNYDIVLKRTKSTIKRLTREPDMLHKYGNIIAEQERNGFIEKVPESEINTSKPVHYIPHNPVKKESSTTPIRIVYDCSCRSTPTHPSLNDCLQSTPPVLNELTSILLRFRLHSYAVTTDIEKAFLQVGLHSDDRDMTRFLWLKDPKDPNSNFTTYRFKVVLFGATCSPFILNATILKHLAKSSHTAVSEILRRDLYVDNVISSFQKEEECVQYYSAARSLMLSAGMNLRSWNSNSTKLQVLARADNIQDTDNVTKVLGLQWEPSTDDVSFIKRDIPELPDVTKRAILKYSSQIYDPLGTLSPVTVRAKLLIQDIWKQKYDWDVPLSKEIQQTWSSLAKDLTTVTNLKFPRKYFQRTTETGNENRMTLHIFVDASVRSYGAVAYICNEEESSFVMAKNRVAPLKTLTLPKIELMAALIGARLIKTLKLIFPSADVILWSDSQIVIHWISLKGKTNRFVENRVDEIRDLTKEYMWKYCPTDQNPADLLTRGITASRFMNNRLWMKGPIWLCDKIQWPTWEILNNLQVHTITEQLVTGGHQPEEDDQMIDGTNQISVTNLRCIINIDNFSCLRRLLRITAYVRRFVQNCKIEPIRRNFNHLSAYELKQAQDIWIKDCQAEFYSREINEMKKNQGKSPLIRQLRLFLDDTGSIRCGGRLNNAPLQEIAKHPYLLPKNSYLTKLIARNAHELLGHSGLNATVTYIRQSYWIPAIRQCVNTVIHKCVICRKVNGLPYKSPEVPPLPKLRVEEAPPFTITGVDFSGALHIKGPTGGNTKAYICLFTCAVTRAIHLEVVSNLSTECFLQAVRRFASRKSQPKLMVSDNAKTFQSASAYLRTMFESQIVRDALTNTGIEWKFIPERSPWYGGWWERLIGITKQTLKKILGRTIVDLETLQTIVTEIESFMNDRPLTFVSSNLNDPEPLTPAHLLYGRTIKSLPYVDVDTEIKLPVSADRNILSKRTKTQSHIIKQFWTRWRTEYLTALRERQMKQGENFNTIRVGEVVQVHDDCPRIQWKLAVVDSLIFGRDNLVRAARIRFSNGLYATRPIVKLYPLEVLNDAKD